MKWISRAHTNHYQDFLSGKLDKTGIDMELLLAFYDYFSIDVGHQFMPLAAVTNKGPTLKHWILVKPDDSLYYMAYHPGDDNKCRLISVQSDNDIPIKDNTTRKIRESLLKQIKGQAPYNTILRRTKAK